jgi:hypothetical protein
MKHLRATAPRPASRLLFLACWSIVCIGAAGCTWLVGEFAYLDRLPPSCREAPPDAPLPGLGQRP